MVLIIYVVFGILFQAVSDDKTSYDILSYIFSYFIYIWRQIKGHVKEIYMVWGTFFLLFSFESL